MAQTALEKKVNLLFKVVKILAERGPGPDVAAMLAGKAPAADEPEGDEAAGSAGGTD